MPKASCAVSPKANDSCYRTVVVRPPDWSRSLSPRFPTQPSIRFLTSAHAPLEVQKAKLATRILIESCMAASDVLVDTAGFLALWDAGDEYHNAAVRLQSELARRRRRFFTTDYIVDETVTLLLLRHS